jgi:4-hydroxy-3-polyprenylbenzoate decarboxylase
VVAVFGPDLSTFTAARMRLPWGRSELDLAGGLRGQPLEVIAGPVTGLPIPAWAEIAIEGEVPPPDQEARDEGPFGEWTGYYSGGTLGTGRPQPVIRVQALYHRRNPILVDSAPLWPGAPRDELQVEAGRLWDQLEAAGVPDVVGVCRYTANLYAVAIRQRYAGHARQAGLAVLGCSTSARDSKYVVIVDDDVDVTNFQEVLWAMTTRVDPAEDIEIVRGHPATPLDPRLPPAARRAGAFTHGCALVYAVRPFEWRAQFPKASRSESALRQEMIERFQHVIPFRTGTLTATPPARANGRTRQQPQRTEPNRRKTDQRPQQPSRSGARRGTGARPR